MATGAPGTNGVWQYGEDDSEATFSALLNKAASTTDSVIGTAKGRITALEAKPTAGLIPIVPSSVDKSGGTATVSTLGKVTFTGVSSISLNNVFSSSYNNYRIMITGGAASTGTAISIRYRASGADRTNNAYYFGGFFSREQGTTTGAWSGSGVTSMTLVSVYNVANTNTVQADISNPADAAVGTGINWQSWNNDGSGGYGIFAGGLYATNNANTGFTLFTAGTITGTVTVYGYNV